VTPERIARDRRALGPILEIFVFSELLKDRRLCGERLTFSHYRDKDQNEVDVVIEDRSGRLVGVEVKAGATGDPGRLSWPQTAGGRPSAIDSRWPGAV